MAFVVDASVCPKWFFIEEHSALARRLLDPGTLLIAPDLLLAELGNVIWKKCTRGEVQPARGIAALTSMHEMGIDFRPSAGFGVEALKIANTLHHPFYDCLYLALAASEGVSFVTADRRLWTKVKGTPFQTLTLWIEDLP